MRVPINRDALTLLFILIVVIALVQSGRAERGQTAEIHPKVFTRKW
jgi:hypothetical protein